MITARHYDTAADILAGAHAVRMRLMKPRNAVKQVLALPSPNPRPVDPSLPLWQKTAIRFDDHVQKHIVYLSQMGGPRRAFILVRCEELGITYTQFIGRDRDDQVCWARKIIWAELRAKFRLSFGEVARLAGGRDPSTIVSGIKSAQKQLQLDGIIRTNSFMLQQDRELIAQISAAYAEGQSLRHLAGAYGITFSVLQRVGKLEGWVKGSPKQFSLEAVRRAYEDGWSLGQISKKFGISERNIGRLRERMGWPIRTRAKRGADH